jgi:hypothetical protein
MKLIEMKWALTSMNCPKPKNGLPGKRGTQWNIQTHKNRRYKKESALKINISLCRIAEKT